jgi:hypothetical protein
MKDGDRESVVPFSDLEVIYETATLFSLALKSGQSILIPKHSAIAVADLSTFLQKLADRNGITYQPELKWKWH